MTAIITNEFINQIKEFDSNHIINLDKGTPTIEIDSKTSKLLINGYSKYNLSKPSRATFHLTDIQNDKYFKRFALLEKGYSSHLVSKLTDLIKTKFEGTTVNVFTKRVYTFCDMHIDDVGVELYYNLDKNSITLSLYANYTHSKPESIDEASRPLYLVNDYYLNQKSEIKNSPLLNVDHDEITVTSDVDKVLINGTRSLVLFNSRKNPVMLSDLQTNEKGKKFSALEKAFNHPIMAVIRSKLEEAFPGKTVFIKNRVYTSYERQVDQVNMYIVVNDSVSVIMYV